ASKSSTSTSIHRARTHRSGRSDADCRPRSSPAIANRKPRRAVPRRVSCKIDHRDEKKSVLGRPGSDLLFQALRLSTIGAEEFNGRVRYGNGFRPLARTTRSAKDGFASWIFFSVSSICPQLNPEGIKLEANRHWK